MKLNKIITCDKAVLKELCKILKVPYDKNIIGFPKEGVFKNNIFDIMKLSDIIKERAI